MHKLTVQRGSKQEILEFDGNPRLSDVLLRAGYAVEQPCGGRGICGKCAVEIKGLISSLDGAKENEGKQRMCQVRLLGDAEVRLRDVQEMEQIETAGAALPLRLEPMDGKFGIAVDVGTTTIALKLFNLADGRCLAEAGMRNPQISTAADVMGRIGAAMEGRLKDLQRQVQTAIMDLIGQVCQKAGCLPETENALVIAGNTTMLYLLTGRSPEALSHAPFEADFLFDEFFPMHGYSAYLPPCMNAFVGADISAAVLASGLCSKQDTSLLVDIGTNGEIALWKNGTLYVTSTAAGPAFEGAGISCGCGSVKGAIDRTWLEDGNIRTHTIGDAQAVGLCGSGLIDAVACFLETGGIDETGAVEADALPLQGDVALLPRDVRAVQLAKAAIAAGIETLMEASGVTVNEIATLYIAGGFGSHLNVESASRIGLIPSALKDRTCILGNASLAGAAMLLLNRGMHGEIRRIVNCAKHVSLGGNPSFNEHYMTQMFFPEE